MAKQRATENRLRTDRPWLFQPGQSGNPGGRPKAEGHVRELARSYTEEAIRTLAELMRTAKNERVRCAAAEALLDRAWGKPTQLVAGDPEFDPVRLAVHMTADDVRALAEFVLKDSNSEKVD
ncbi:MAG: DUF5681 domain-containing protein [Anaerolineae bacterium]